MAATPIVSTTPAYNVTITPNATIAAWYAIYEGKIVPLSYLPGYTVLSYLVSYVGSWTTLELFNQRTADRGVKNWNILLASSVSMGGVAIWCMHFIGNRAIVLVQGQLPLQISYNSGFTVLSFFVPILVLLVAFTAVGSNEAVSLMRVSLGGSLAGLAICGMHYLGQAGISNYTPTYVVANVLGSIIIAEVASITALAVFFMLRATWSGSWWKRGLCAVVLAGAVSGMHWCATVGTSYRLDAPDWPQINYVKSSRDSTTIVVAVLSFTACIILLTFTIVSQMRKAQTKDRAQMVVLASVIFDKDGRILVTPEGHIPNEKITKQYIERSFDDVFGITHSVYLWLYRTTRNWSGIAGLIPGMRKHLAMVCAASHTKTEINLVNDNGDPIEHYSIVFRELFCVAAADLADSLGFPLDEMGVLYDEIINTGQSSRKRKNALSCRTEAYAKQSSMSFDLEGLAGFGRGQLLFLVRKVIRQDAEQLLANGYRFAGLSNIIDILAHDMRVDKSELGERLLSMRDYVNANNILEPGVHTGLFAIRAHIGGEFDVLVRRDARNQLPTMQLPVDKLEEWQTDYLDTLEGKTVTVCLKVLKSKSESNNVSEREKVWAGQFYNTLDALSDEISEPYFCDALLISKPVGAPCRGPSEKSRPDVCQMIAFRTIVPINVRKPNSKLEFTPLKFLKMQQHVYKNSPDHAIWERKIYREFAPFMGMMEDTAPSDGRSSGRFPKGHKRSSDHHDSEVDPLESLTRTMPAIVNILGRKTSGRDVGNEASRRHAWKFWRSPTLMTGGMRGKSRAANGITSPPGGIMVSSAVSIDVNERRKRTPSIKAAAAEAGIEMANFSGNKGAPASRKDDIVGPSKGAGFEDFDIMFGGGPHGQALGMNVDLNYDGLGTKVEVVREICDAATFVDELMKITIEKRAGG